PHARQRCLADSPGCSGTDATFRFRIAINLRPGNRCAERTLSPSQHCLSPLRHIRVSLLLRSLPSGATHMKQIVLGWILGGLVLFVWSVIAHMPPLGTAGERVVDSAQEPAVLNALRSAM